MIATRHAAFGFSFIAALALTATAVSAASEPKQIAGNIARAAQGAGVPEPACPSSGVLEAGESDYGNELIKKVSANVFYLEDALAAGQQGVVSLCMKIGADGTISPIVVDRSTGYPLLDGSALYAAGFVALGKPRDYKESSRNISRNLAKAPVPAALLNGQASVWMRVPVRFALEGEAAATAPAPASFADGTLDRTTCRLDSADVGAVTPHKRDAFNLAMQSSLVEFSKYPIDLLKYRVEGKAGVLVDAAKDRSLNCARIETSSGSPLINGIALITVGLMYAKNQQPAFPETAADHLRTVLPMHYSIE